MRNKALYNKALLREQLWLITPYKGRLFVMGVPDMGVVLIQVLKDECG